VETGVLTFRGCGSKALDIIILTLSPTSAEALRSSPRMSKDIHPV